MLYSDTVHTKLVLTLTNICNDNLIILCIRYKNIGFNEI